MGSSRRARRRRKKPDRNGQASKAEHTEAQPQEPEEDQPVHEPPRSHLVEDWMNWMDKRNGPRFPLNRRELSDIRRLCENTCNKHFLPFRGMPCQQWWLPEFVRIDVNQHYPVYRVTLCVETQHGMTMRLMRFLHTSHNAVDDKHELIRTVDDMVNQFREIGAEAQSVSRLPVA